VALDDRQAAHLVVDHRLQDLRRIVVGADRQGLALA
jgi:hypothetical protein